MDFSAIMQGFIETPITFLWQYLLPFLLVITVLVFVHEFGHYYIARRCGVKVDVFSIGFGKELFGFTDKAGTRWKFSLIPLGGYVKMFGDQDPASAKHSDKIEIEDEAGREERSLTAEEKKVAFFAKPVTQRAAIVFAGPAINFIFAILLLALLYGFYGQPYTPAQVHGLVEDGAAETAGIQLKDEIIAINGRDVTRFEDIQRAVAISLNTPLDLTLLRDDQEIQMTVTPQIVEQEDRFGFRHSVGRLGIIGPRGETAVEKHGFISALTGATIETWRITTGTLEALGQMITGVRSADELGGIIRIGALAGDFAQSGLIALITFTALLSINLGLINLFPIPLLDGGHLMFYAVEAIKGSPITDQVQEYAFRFGLAVVLAIMLFATWNDLVQLNVIERIKDLVS